MGEPVGAPADRDPRSITNVTGENRRYVLIALESVARPDREDTIDEVSTRILDGDQPSANDGLLCRGDRGTEPQHDERDARGQDR
jgi:hypothetical protein